MGQEEVGSSGALVVTQRNVASIRGAGLLSEAQEAVILADE